MFQIIAVYILSIMISFSVVAGDNRIQVDLPLMMKEHMLSNMRDHLLALQTITYQLSSKQYDAAAETAEQRLGMSSMDNHGASHLGKFMPKEMGSIGTNMHKAASQFALIAKDAEIEGGLEKAFGALSEVMKHCVACHEVYKVHP
ncbi:MAG: hypothetical protein HQL46_07735 [Gammaproteobacteria bacterium]|nr:hypothetical protein [Gammaproteobacteria bacterium]